MIRKYGVIAILAPDSFCAHIELFPKAVSDGTIKPLPFIGPIFGDNMVLQRGKANTIWGWPDPGDKVRVYIADKTASGTAVADRRWEVKIEPPPAGGPYTIKISGHQAAELHNVLVGDVWLCGGQSSADGRLVTNGAKLEEFSIAGNLNKTTH